MRSRGCRGRREDAGRRQHRRLQWHLHFQEVRAARIIEVRSASAPQGDRPADSWAGDVPAVCRGLCRGPSERQIQMAARPRNQPDQWVTAARCNPFSFPSNILQQLVAQSGRRRRTNNSNRSGSSRKRCVTRVGWPAAWPDPARSSTPILPELRVHRPPLLRRIC